MTPAPSCTLCGTGREPFSAPDGRSYLQCPSCDWIQDRGPAPSLERQRERYLRHDNSGNNQGYVAMLEAFLRGAVEPFAPKGVRSLDLGCGPEPVLARLLKDRGWEGDAYDPIFHPLDFRKRTYGLITMTEVLEHLADPLGALEGPVLSLERGGILSLQTLFHPGRRDAFLDWWYRRDETHLSFYSLKTLGVLGGRIGLDLVHSDGVRLAVLQKP